MQDQPADEHPFPRRFRKYQNAEGDLNEKRVVGGDHNHRLLVDKARDWESLKLFQTAGVVGRGSVQPPAPKRFVPSRGQVKQGHLDPNQSLRPKRNLWQRGTLLTLPSPDQSVERACRTRGSEHHVDGDQPHQSIA